MTSRGRIGVLPVTRTGLVAILIGLVTMLSGCVSVPTSGPVEKVNGAPPACQNCVNVEVAPPAAGDEPRQIVEGYLRATSNYQAGYAVAKQYLTKAAAEKWSPDNGVTIFRQDTLLASNSTVTLKGRFVGSLEKDRSYTARDTVLKQDFQLQKEGNEWRINSLPGGLFVSENAFRNFYQPMDLYFLSKPDGASLVPDPIYLPSLRDPANLASALMKALLSGPSLWLGPAVGTAVPPNTTLKVDSVTITDGIAEVPLTDTVLALSDPERSQLAAQIVYTLKQLSPVKGVLITVNGSRFRVPQSDPNTMIVNAESISSDMDPVPPVPRSQLYSVTSAVPHKVQVTSGTVDTTATQDLSEKGALGTGRYSVDALAVSATNTDIAVVTDDRRCLLQGSIADRGVDSLLKRSAGATHLLRPQYSRFGELWAIGDQDGRQKLWVVQNDKLVEVPVAGSVLSDGRVTAFKISPDGTRMAIIREGVTGSELGVTRIVRSDKTTVSGWRPLDTQQQNNPVQLSQMSDVAWTDATNLLVLGAGPLNKTVAPYQISDDALDLARKGQPANWKAVEITVELHTQIAVIRGSSNQTWRDDGSQWVLFRDGVKAVAYPG